MAASDRLRKRADIEQKKIDTTRHTGPIEAPPRHHEPRSPAEYPATPHNTANYTSRCTVEFNGIVGHVRWHDEAQNKSNQASRNQHPCAHRAYA